MVTTPSLGVSYYSKKWHVSEWLLQTSQVYTIRLSSDSALLQCASVVQLSVCPTCSQFYQCVEHPLQSCA